MDFENCLSLLRDKNKENSYTKEMQSMNPGNSGILPTAKEQAAIEGLKKLESTIDQSISALGNITSEDLRKLRSDRCKALLAEANRMQLWRSQNHGILNEVASQKEWFDEVKNNERTVCLFYRPTSRICEILDAHLCKLAPKHMETKFLRVNVEKSPFICDRLGIYIMPTMIFTKDCFTTGRMEGFDDVGGTQDFSTETLEGVLVSNGIIDPVLLGGTGEALPQPEGKKKEKTIKSGAILYESDDSEDW